jgi:hypothetical protein
VKRSSIRSLSILVAVAAAIGTVALAAPAGASGSAPTCAKLTAKVVQPLIAAPITNVSTKRIDGTLYFQGKKTVGQTCTYATDRTDDAAVLTVIGGPAAARAWKSEVQSVRATVAVPGVGAKALRQKADDKGAVSTPEVVSMKGSTFCTADVEVEEVPGGGALEDAAGATVDIGDQAYAVIAAAAGTLCNRIYGSGSTTPDLSRLASITVPTTAGLDRFPGAGG